MKLSGRPSIRNAEPRSARTDSNLLAEQFSALPRLLSLLILLLSTLSLPARAHVGSQFVVFDGKAGSFPVRVVVRQPEVVPGLAEISVRVLGGQPARVTALPIHSATDRSGAPRPDVAERVPGETNLFTAQLWFMTRGAYGVEVAVEGTNGERGGALMVPVNSVATVQKPLPKWLGGALAGMGLLLIAGFISIVAGAVRESTLSAASEISRSRRRFAWVGGNVALIVAGGAVYGGAAWWRFEERIHQSRVLFRPLEHSVAVTNVAGRLVLRLSLTDERMANPRYSLVPDHGKLMHLFLIGPEPEPAFVHLHPAKRTDGTFEAALPPLPSGNYRMFADVTHEAGLAQTLTNTVAISAGGDFAFTPTDDADSWLPATAPASGPVALGDGFSLSLSVEGALRPGEPVSLRAQVLDAAGKPATLEAYLRMLGHAVIARDDGSVFAHLHPAGTLSMAAARRFAQQVGGSEAARATEVNCGDLDAVPPAVAAALARSGEVSFPFVFPAPGEYRVWVQVRLSATVRTTCLRVTVPDGKVAAR